MSSLEEMKRELMNPFIVCAALQYEGGRLVIGPRHFDHVMQPQIHEWNLLDRPIQGFIDQTGRFYSRKEAWIIAHSNGQIKRRVGNDGPDGAGLFSENLY